MFWLGALVLLALLVSQKDKIYHFMVNVAVCSKCNRITTDWYLEKTTWGVPVKLCRKCRKESFHG